MSLILTGCQSSQDDSLGQKSESVPLPTESVPPKPVKKPITPASRETSTTEPTTSQTPTEETPPAATASPPPAPAQPEAPLLTNQQIDRYLADGQVTYERAAKLRYREAVRAGQVKTKADHAYWSTVTEIYRNWDNRYITWEEVQKRLADAESAHNRQ